MRVNAFVGLGSCKVGRDRVELARLSAGKVDGSVSRAGLAGGACEMAA